MIISEKQIFRLMHFATVLQKVMVSEDMTSSEEGKIIYLEIANLMRDINKQQSTELKEIK